MTQSERSGRRVVVIGALLVVALGVVLGVVFRADTEPAGVERAKLAGFGEVAATITDASGKTCEVCLLAAYTPTQRDRGLMEVTDPTLGGYDGMVFVYDEPSSGAFWMRNTPMPLSIAFFDGEGQLISTSDMAPCADRGDCPLYPAAAPFSAALEVVKGGLGDLLVKPGSTMVLGARTCPLAKSVRPPVHTGSQ